MQRICSFSSHAKSDKSAKNVSQQSISRISREGSWSNMPNLRSTVSSR
uniref:Uncharacterized protein n=1 Tax=Arundo donax TaxID=35708 RepID=A0A0A9CQA7_ARUDO